MVIFSKVQLLRCLGIAIYCVVVRAEQGFSDDSISRRTLLQDTVIVAGTKVDPNKIFFPEVQLEAILGGQDDRKPVENPLEFPFNTIGKITLECPCGPGQCTGQIIGPRMVLTAGHCAYDVQDCNQNPTCCEKPCENFKFTPAYPLANETYLVDEVITPQGFIQGFQNKDDFQKFGQFDITVFKLDRDFTTKNFQTMSYGFFGCEDKKKDMEIFIAGYPANLDDGKKMYYSQCIVSVNRCDPMSFFYHTCDTSGGMSGAAIWAREGGDNVVVIGVHSRSEKDNGTIQNVGVLLNRASAGYVTNLQELFTG